MCQVLHAPGGRSRHRLRGDLSAGDRRRRFDTASERVPPVSNPADTYRSACGPPRGAVTGPGVDSVRAADGARTYAVPRWIRPPRPACGRAIASADAAPVVWPEGGPVTACVQCHAPLGDGRFCGRCGAPVSASVPPVAEAHPRLAPTDLMRDAGALAALIWVLVAPWTPDGSGGGTVYVLLTVLCAMASLVLPYLQRALVRPDGTPVRWPTMPLRLLLSLPLAVVVLVTVIRNLVFAMGEGGDGLAALGPGVAAAAFGWALVSVPRGHELRDRADRDRIARRWRLLAGWAAGLGLVAVALSTILALTPFDQLGRGGWLAVILLMLAGAVLFVVCLLAVPAMCVGADHPTWQPSALWLGSMFVFLLAVGSGAGTPALESADAPLYGWWLLLLGTGLCALPMTGGRDGSRRTVEYWVLIVVHAFRIVVVCATVLACVLLLLIIDVQRFADVPGVLVWSLIAAIASALAAAVGSSRLRADPVAGRNAALAASAFMLLMAVIDWIVAGAQGASVVGTGTSVGQPVLIGTCAVIILGLVAPRPIRQAVAARAAAAPMTMGATAHPVPPAGAWSGANAAPAAGPPVTPGGPLVAPATRASQAPGSGSADPGSDDRARAADPATPPADLMSIAQYRPDLRPLVAGNPSTYPALLEWLGRLGDPAVDAVLMQRRGSSR